MPVGDITTFQYTGGQQTWVVPADCIEVEIEAWGAAGGDNVDVSSASGGLGGYAKGRLAVTPGETLYVRVGGKGSSSNSNPAGGWNGGAAGGSYSGNGVQFVGRGGGGATDIRQGGSAVSDRKIIAAGGGGAAGYDAARVGGTGGGTTGAAGAGGTAAGGGGTQSAGGSAGSGTDRAGSAGNLGTGGAGATGYSGWAYCGGGGGGGYFGGGGGAGGAQTSGAGGGGSGYTGGVTSATMSSGVRSGNGLATIKITVENVIPNAPTVAAADSVAVGAPLNVSWTHNDPESNPQAKAQVRWRKYIPEPISAAVVDTATKGNWVGVYGSSGYRLFAFTGPAPGTDVTSNPALIVAESGVTRHHWSSADESSTAVLTNSAGTNRRAACAFVSADLGSMSFTFTPSGGFKGYFRVYCLDYDSIGRSQSLKLSKGQVSRSTTISSFSGGKWVSWLVDCPAGESLVLTVTDLVSSTANAVVSAIMLDGVA